MNVTRSTNDETITTNQPKIPKCTRCGADAADWSRGICEDCYEEVKDESGK